MRLLFIAVILALTTLYGCYKVPSCVPSSCEGSPCSCSGSVYYQRVQTSCGTYQGGCLYY
ncbi:MAG: hypothetical protein L3V56_05345 [Candidatus Magnetoovum sp. WYHC-5]|nr:hypothetical protein [Candidatus Magnetoovum sp. WYHC-5]